MQAIVTKYHGPTNTLPGRISAQAEAGRVIMQWDHGLNPEQNHLKAALTLCRKFKWVPTQGKSYSELVGGDLPGGKGNMVFVFNNDFATRGTP